MRGHAFVPGKWGRKWATLDIKTTILHARMPRRAKFEPIISRSLLRYCGDVSQTPPVCSRYRRTDVPPYRMRKIAVIQAHCAIALRPRPVAARPASKLDVTVGICPVSGVGIDRMKAMLRTSSSTTKADLIHANLRSDRAPRAAFKEYPNRTMDEKTGQ